jgi:hypothetical protein
MAAEPGDGLELSVVVPSVNGWDDLEGCLLALAAEQGHARLEVLVADRCGSAVRDPLRAKFPWVRLIEASRETTIPQLRSLAFEAARSSSVAVIEDHVIVPSGWARELLAFQARGEDVVGGSVENAATDRLVDWAAFLCEYSHLLPPVPDGPVASLPGNNTVYRRSLLERYRPEISQGRWEDYLHRRMREDGIILYSRPSLQVDHKKHYTILEYLTQRYLYSRSFAGLRLGDASAGRRLLYGVAALLLPPLLLVRTVGTVWRKKYHRRELIRTIPLLALFVSGWAWGEVVGAWFGPGDALARVC